MNLNNLSSTGAGEVSGAKNVLANDVEIKGSIRFANELLFDGKIEGELISDGNLTIGKNAQVNGEIRTKSVCVMGTVTGNITVTDKCELKSSSTLTGDLKANRIVIEEGATFIGKSEVTPNKSALAKAEAQRASAPASDAGARKTTPAQS